MTLRTFQACKKLLSYRQTMAAVSEKQIKDALGKRKHAIADNLECVRCHR